MYGVGTFSQGAREPGLSTGLGLCYVLQTWANRELDAQFGCRGR